MISNFFKITQKKKQKKEEGRRRGWYLVDPVPLLLESGRGGLLHTVDHMAEHHLPHHRSTQTMLSGCPSCPLHPLIRCGRERAGRRERGACGGGRFHAP
jgi:hypothetical protein